MSSPCLSRGTTHTQQNLHTAVWETCGGGARPLAGLFGRRPGGYNAPLPSASKASNSARSSASVLPASSRTTWISCASCTSHCPPCATWLVTPSPACAGHASLSPGCGPRTIFRAYEVCRKRSPFTGGVPLQEGAAGNPKTLRFTNETRFQLLLPSGTPLYIRGQMDEPRPRRCASSIALLRRASWPLAARTPGRHKPAARARTA